MIQIKFEKEGIYVSYMNCVHALKRLKIEWFGSDIEQYNQISSYIVKINDRCHETKLENANDEFLRLCVIFQEIMQAFKPCIKRVFDVDNTLLKTFIYEVLLVAWFRNGNNEIQIVEVGIVLVENKDNWTWNLNFLLSHLQPTPAFMIPDRYKVLVNAVQTTVPDVPHLLCFRHLMDNLNKQYKSKKLENLAWLLDSSRTKVAYEKAEADIARLDKSALAWIKMLDLENDQQLTLHVQDSTHWH